MARGGVTVVRCRYAEVALQRLPDCIGRVGHGNAGRGRAVPQQAADEAAGHVAATNECDLQVIECALAHSTRRLASGALAEQRRADAHQRRAFVRSPLRGRALMPIESVSSRRPGVPRFVRSRAGAANPRAAAAAVALIGRHAHQAAQPQPRQRRDLRDAAPGSSGATPPFARFAGDVHLQAHIQRRRVCGALLGQPLGDPQPVHAMDPGEMLGHGAGLVRLQLADEVPGGSRSAQASILAGPPARSSRRSARVPGPLRHAGFGRPAPC